MNLLKALFIPTLSLGLVACELEDKLKQALEEPSQQEEQEQPDTQATPQTATALDEQLKRLIDQHGLRGDAALNRDIPSIEDPVTQLGMQLFYSKSLGGQLDSACVSCHHPALGGADGLSLPIGVDALNPDLLGPGRQHKDGLPPVPRNAPTAFNAALWDSGLFMDSRVESLGKEFGTNGSISGIRTPDSHFNQADNSAGANLAAAQARFPVTSEDEMKGTSFEEGGDNVSVRDHLAARIGNYDEGFGELTQNNWLDSFQLAFSSAEDARSLVTFNNIAFALGEFERSMTFTNNPWKNYIEGNLSALTEQQKSGAQLFFNPPEQGGANCVACHAGDFFTDEKHHTVAFPQFGPGKGNLNNDDFARARETGNDADRYRFRTPSLLNIATTSPYGHAGTYQSLHEVVRHYINPRGSVDNFFNRGGACHLNQFNDIINCDNLYPDSQNNSNLALTKLDQERRERNSLLRPIRLNNTQVDQLVAFLNALTDPCTRDASCLAKWIPSGNGPDNQQLNAIFSRQP